MHSFLERDGLEVMLTRVKGNITPRALCRNELLLVELNVQNPVLFLFWSPKLIWDMIKTRYLTTMKRIGWILEHLEIRVPLDEDKEKGLK